MPKPLAQVNAAATYNFSPGVLYASGKIAPRFAAAISAWSVLEAELGRSLVELLHTQPEVALAIYNQMKTSPTKMAALEVAAKLKLTETQAKIFGVLLNRTSELQQERNTLAHGIWGFSAELPDALLRVSPIEILRHELRDTDPALFPRDKVMVYFAEDFEDLVGRMWKLSRLFMSFWIWVDPKTWPVVLDQWRDELAAEPAIAAILFPSPPRRKNKPSKRPQSPPKDPTP